MKSKTSYTSHNAKKSEHPVSMDSLRLKMLKTIDENPEDWTDQSEFSVNEDWHDYDLRFPKDARVDESLSKL